MYVKNYKYFVAYSYIDDGENIRFDNCFTTVKCKLHYTSILESLTKELEAKYNRNNLTIINFQLIGETK